MDFALFVYSAQYAEYRYCAVVIGVPFRVANDRAVCPPCPAVALCLGLRQIFACARNPPYGLVGAALGPAPLGALLLDGFRHTVLDRFAHQLLGGQRVGRAGFNLNQ